MNNQNRLGTRYGDSREIDQEKIRKRNERERKRQALDANIADLYKRYVYSIQKDGEQAINTVILQCFLELICQLKSLNEIVDSLGYVMETLDSSLSLMECTMEFISDIMTQRPGIKSPFLAKIRTRKKVKNFCNSFNARMAEVLGVVGMIPNLTGSVQKAMVKMSTSMNASMAKTQKQREKYTANSGTGGVGFGGGLSASSMKILGDMGVISDDDASAGAADYGPSGGSGGGSVSGPEDGSDIL